MTILSESERREIARRHLDAGETWLRSLVQHQLATSYGTEYFSASLPSGSPVIPKRIREKTTSRREAEPTRFNRSIDATMLDEAIDIVLHPDLFSKHFEPALIGAFPDGPREARTFLEKLKGHRDRLSHGGTCSSRDLEQCVCYSNDLIDSVKKFFRELKMDRVFNVPTFTRIVDSIGNDHRLSLPSEGQGHFIDLRPGGKGDLYPGDIVRIEIEVDESFERDGYLVKWMTFNGDRGEGMIVELAIEAKHVGEHMDVRFEVVSTKEWHRLLGGCDDRLDLRYRVLPPRC